MPDIKDSSFVRFFYRLPGASSAYHFLWAWAGAKVRRNPSRKLIVIGITGTKGKTTTIELLNAMLEAAGNRTAILSSLRIKVGEENEKNPMGNSMPGRAYLQRFLARAVRARCSHALIEVTSQGIVQHRHRFVDWSVGAITNLAPEHIESHGSFENYRAAKLSFLEYVLGNGGKIFLNFGDKHFKFFSDALRGNAATVSKDNGALKQYMPKRIPGPSTFLWSDFNMENAAIAAAIAKQLNIPDGAIKKALAGFKSVTGRAEFIEKDGYTAVVDYAHTPDSLEAIYKAVKPKQKGRSHPRLICVLGGTGGGRDRWKRPAMGAIAAQYCDEMILTNEDPYDEDPAEILREIEAGIPESSPQQKKIRTIIDRREAIRTAVRIMRKGDVVIGTGKGSEDWIHIARGGKVPWNERQEFEHAIREKKK